MLGGSTKLIQKGDVYEGDMSGISARKIPKWVSYLFYRPGKKISKNEKKLFSPDVLEPNTRNISLNADGSIKGAIGSEENIKVLKALILRFRTQAKNLIFTAFPEYKLHLKLAPTSFRPLEVSDRATSWRADDKRLHVDAFPSRPNYGERILRVFINVNPEGVPRVWRIGEPFSNIASQYLEKIKPYSYIYANIHQLI
jgi:hypothetical protein